MHMIALSEMRKLEKLRFLLKKKCCSKVIFFQILAMYVGVFEQSGIPK